jgi:gliding motility-associated-like protein
MNVRLARYFFVLAGALLLSLASYSQELPEFSMSDTTLTECQGILYDSGGENGLYGNDQNLTLVIDVNGPISVTFLSTMELDPGFDFITFYDGPSSASPQIGSYTGVVLPPNFTTSSGFLTIVFTSDGSGVYLGWALQWEAEVPPPIPPALSVPSSPLCNSSTFTTALSTPLPCELFDNATWQLSLEGQEVEIISAQPVCNNGITSSISVSVADPFTLNCPYNVELEIGIPDECGTIYIFNITTTFNVTSCISAASLEAADNTVCVDECTSLLAIPPGCFTYSYQWSNGLPPTAGPHIVCPSSTTTYSVQITEMETGQVTVETATLQVLSSAIITQGDTVCQSVDDIVLLTQSPGEWSGPGIWEEDSNVFDPDSAFAGNNDLIFVSQGCSDTVSFFVIPIQTDDITAACPGTDPFLLNASPSGGVWSGPFTTPSGIFDPSVAGSYEVVYTTPQCTDLLTVNVAPITGVFFLDTLCQSVLEDTLEFDPLGGYWTGPGIADSLNGIFIPGDAPPGLVELLYTINGCEQVFEVFIKEINIGPSFVTVCPAQEPLVWYDVEPLPTGGFWEGDGVIDTTTGLYDPASIPNDTYTSIIYYAPNGCSDTTFIYNITTDIGLDSAFLCLGSDPLELIESVVDHSPPYGGEWLGTATQQLDWDYWIFDPSVAGVGVYTLTYLENTCSDDLVVTVYPDQAPVSTASFCSNEEPIVFDQSNLQGDVWIGQGITDPSNGNFDPSLGEIGNSEVIWTSNGGCTDTIAVFIDEFFQAEITGLAPFYCFTDSLITFAGAPVDAVWSGDVTLPEINPAVLGEGLYTAILTYTGVLCNSADTVNFEVYPPLTAELTASDTLLCGGQGSTLQVVANGGNPNANYTYQWSDGGFPVSTHVASPQSTTTITVTTSDGCSDPAVNSVLLTVLPPIEVVLTTSDTLCFGEIGFATASALQPGNYEYNWNGTIGATIDVTAGSTQELTVVDLENGCEFDTSVFIPNFPPLSANFLINPNSGCVPYGERSSISFIDVSQNGVSGTWDFGNGQTAPYTPGSTPDQTYPGAGNYTITLSLENSGGCLDTATATLCILPEVPVFIPDIFSPNGDGNNDVFRLRGHGIIALEFLVYSRWGELVFSSKDINKGWDGTINGKPQPSGNYIYYIQASLNDGSVQELKGEVTLVR